MCLEAIGSLEKLIANLGDTCGFQRKKCLYLAQRENEITQLKKEFLARKRAGFDLEFLTRMEIENRFSFSAPAALLTHDAAQFDPYRFAHRLIRRAAKDGLRVFARTEVIKVDDSGRQVRLTTDRQRVISAKKVIMAAGFETQMYLRKKLVKLRSTY